MRLLLLLSLVFLSSCYVSENIQKSIVHYKVDYRPYLEKGFRIYEEIYPGDYDNLGYFEIVLTPGVAYTSSLMWSVDNYKVNEGLDALYKHALDFGANGVMNFSYTLDERTHPAGKGYMVQILKGNYILINP